MLTFWRSPNTDRHEYRFYTSLLNRYDRDQSTFKIKVLTVDEIDHGELNVYMTTVTDGKLNPSRNIFDFEIKKDSDNIKFAVDNNMHVYIDYSWEEVNLNTFKNLNLYTNDWKFIKDNNIKLLCNNSHHRELKNMYDLTGKKFPLEDYEDFFVPFDLFPYNVRAWKHAHNKTYQMSTAPILGNDRKYFFSMFLGEIRKTKNVMLKAELLKRNLDKVSAYSSFLGTNLADEVRFKEQHLNLKEHFGDNHPMLKYMNEHNDDIIKHELFERYDTVKGRPDDRFDNVRERRMPQVAYDSHLYLAPETQASWNNCFYTEKTYKPIAAGLPFIILGSYRQNAILNEYHGYEIFDEIIDYSFDNISILNVYDYHLKYTYEVFDELERLIKEGPSIFYKRSVRDKVLYNQNLFLNRTKTSALYDDIKRTFFKVKSWDD